MSIWILVGLLAVAHEVPTELRTTAVPLHPAVGPSLIVGRTVCGGSTWLLTKSAELIRLAHASRIPLVRRVRDLRQGDSFWGLACLDDGSLWTLATGHALVRMTPDGAIVERVPMVMPQVEVFGVADRLVLLGLPVVPDRPVLSVGPRSNPGMVRPWVGLVARAGFGNTPSLSTNLVGCGIAFRFWIPCWFVDQPSVSISDGATARSVRMPWLMQRGVDRSAPIHDVALVPDGSMWVLAASSTASSNASRVGQRLSRVTPSGVERQSLSLAPSVRLILWADATGCTLLTVNGGLLRVSNEGG